MNKISDLKVGNKVATKYFGIGNAYFVGNNYCVLEKLERRMGCCNFWQSEIDWQKTTELNKKNMKELEMPIIPPKGMEIDKEKSTFEKIVFKEIGFKFPESVTEIPNRNWYINSGGGIDSIIDCNNISQLSSKERAEAFLSLIQLVELRDYVNGDWEANWNSDETIYNIEVNNDIVIYQYSNIGRVLNFKSRKIAEKFAEKYKSLIETAKELL